MYWRTETAGEISYENAPYERGFGKSRLLGGAMGVLDNGCLRGQADKKRRVVDFCMESADFGFEERKQIGCPTMCVCAGGWEKRKWRISVWKCR